MPSDLHDILLNEKLKQMENEGWLCFTEKEYLGKRFDIIGFNPLTKECKAVEIQTNGIPKSNYDNLPIKVEWIYPNREFDIDKFYIELIKLFKALNSIERLYVLFYLENGSKRYIQINNNTFKIASPLLAYHIRKLVRLNLIEKVALGYQLTNKGKLTLNILRQFNLEKV